MRFHIPGIPHTVTTREYSTCAFTPKVWKLCAMLVSQGHTVIHYGHVDSKLPPGVQHNSVLTRDDLEQSYPKWNWRRNGWPPTYSAMDHCYMKFNTVAPDLIRRNAQPGDMLLCSFSMHKTLADQLPEMTCVESGIGYPGGVWADYRVFESYAIMHAYQGNACAQEASESHWYDAVIPNAFNEDEFTFNEKPRDYLLFVGRVNHGKGIHIAYDLARNTRHTLVVAGARTQEGYWPEGDHNIEYVGVVSPKQRRKLMAGAKATICASTFLEPFCGVQIESMLSGTPVISSDWGAFTEYNLHGKTGYRCRTFEQFVFAVNNIGDIDRRACRDWGLNFTLDAIAPRYTDYLQSVHDSKLEKKWYTTNWDRKTLLNSSNCPGDV